MSLNGPEWRKMKYRTLRLARRKQIMLFFLLLLWVLYLCLNTFVASLSALWHLKNIAFSWNSAPDLLEFFKMYDLTVIHTHWFIVKLGHFAGFAIMYLLLFLFQQNHAKALFLSVMFALFTEILQLFFQRDGRIYDWMIDNAGILLMYILIVAISKLEWKSGSRYTEKQDYY